MKRIWLAALMSALFSQVAMASEMNAEKLYPLFCGTKQQVIAANDGQPLSKQEWAELTEQREGILAFLNSPKETLQKYYESQSGGFAVIVLCGTVVQLNPGLEQDGCVDLKTSRVVKDTQGGVALCQSIMDRVGK